MQSMAALQAQSHAVKEALAVSRSREAEQRESQEAGSATRLQELVGGAPHGVRLMPLICA
jgi:hypothetical protein